MANGGTCARHAVYSLLLVALAVAAGADPVAAQFSQYRPPGKLDSLEASDAAAADDARWRLGPLRIDPLLTLGNLAWVDNVFATPEGSESVSDLRGTLSAGLNVFLPVGRKTVLSGFVLPSYTWWRERQELRSLVWNVGARAQVTLNRLELELSGREVTVERFLNSELDVPTEISSTGGSIGFALDVRGPWQLVGSFSSSDSGYSVRDPLLASRRVESLDRTERVARLGLGYTLTNGLRIRLGAESSEADFSDPGATRSNSSFGPSLEIALDGNRLDVQLTANSHSIEFDSGLKSRLNAGRLQLGFEITPRLSLSPYLYRTLVYSARDSGSYYEEERFGLAISLPRSERLTLQLFYDTGDNTFRTASSSVTTRIDDVEAYGGGFELALTRRLTFTFGAARIEYRSPLPELDRSANRVSTAIELAGFSLLPD